MKKYSGRLSFLPVDANYSPRSGSVSKEIYTPRKNSATEVMDVESDTQTDSDQEPKNNREGTRYQTKGDSPLSYKSILSPLLPALDQPVPEGWVTIEDEFILVGGIYQSHLAKDNLMTPEATLDDGLIHLVFVRGDCSRVNLIRLFVALEGGLEVRENDHSTEVVKVLGFRLEPHSTTGLMTVDGERIDYGPIQAQVLPSMARVMSIKTKNN